MKVDPLYYNLLSFMRRPRNNIHPLSYKLLSIPHHDVQISELRKIQVVFFSVQAFQDQSVCRFVFLPYTFHLPWDRKDGEGVYGARN